MAKESFVELVDQLAQEYISQSTGSIDYVFNAKAIALGNPDVKKRIVAQLEQGFRLTHVGGLSGFGSGLLDFRLLFEFEPTAERATKEPAIDVTSSAFVVSVELPTKAVRSISDYRPAPADQQSDVPFSVSFPNPAAYRVVPNTTMATSRQRDAAFFGEMGLSRARQGWAIDPSPLDDPSGLGGRGGSIINPGGSFAGRTPIGDDGGTVTYDATDVPTKSTTQTASDTSSATSSETVSNNFVDDTGSDDTGSDDTTPSDNSQDDDGVYDGQTGDNPHPDNDLSMFSRPDFGRSGFARPGFGRPPLRGPFRQ